MKFIAAISAAAAMKHKSSQDTTTGGPGGPPPATGTCENGPGVDSFGDGCEWYEDYPTDCGWYDTDDWSAHDACCVCHGAPMPDTTEFDDMYDDYDYCGEMVEMFEYMFVMMDADGSGSISAQEAMEFGLTQEDLEFFGGFDVDGDEELSMEELTPVVNEALDYYGCEAL